MSRNHFKERAEVRMTALGLTQADVAELVGVPRPKVANALGGETTTSAARLRTQLEQVLTRMCDEKRDRMAAEIEERRAVQCPELVGQLSVILPEDMLYIVTEDGIPVGAWNPASKTYRDLDAAVLPVVGRRVK